MLKDLKIFIGCCYSIMIALRIAFRYAVSRNMAGERACERDMKFDAFRGRVYMDWEDCLGCNRCAEVCPTECIFITSIPAAQGEDLGITSEGQSKTNWVLEFDLDMSKCMLCGFCVDPCPTQCIALTPEFAYTVGQRANLVYHFTPFTPETAFNKFQEYQR